MMPPLDIRLSAYHYDLPPARIAQAPLAQRDQARLLCYRGGTIDHHTFQDLPRLLPPDSLLLFNDTKVIQARLHFQRATGAQIEVLLLNPVQPVAVEQAMLAQGHCQWQCVIGNRKRWKPGEVLQRVISHPEGEIQLSATLIDRTHNVVAFTWEPAELAFVNLLSRVGEVPLPPYLNRAITPQDIQQYQTVYAQQAGAVAAPTAGLHVTDQVLDALNERGIPRQFVTLHVSAGTFLPVKTDEVMAHVMHAEQMIIERETVARLLAHPGRLIPVGTTSLRWLESLYWLGLRLVRGQVLPPDQVWTIDKEEPYQQPASELPPPQAVLQALLDYLDQHGLARTFGDTRLLIVPGYPFRLTQGLVTNFHLPETTLILLVAALIGEDWRAVYEAALAGDYRFLSYGDSSLLLPR
jgi:S-adenosylmethionine:tRNA ribosyltransferase-isomerase